MMTAMSDERDRLTTACLRVGSVYGRSPDASAILEDDEGGWPWWLGLIPVSAFLAEDPSLGEPGEPARRETVEAWMAARGGAGVALHESPVLALWGCCIETDCACGPDGEPSLRLLDGAHRLRAAMAAGLSEVPVLLGTKPS